MLKNIVILLSYLLFSSHVFAFQNLNPAIEQDRLISQFRMDFKKLTDSIYRYPLARRSKEIHKQLSSLKSLENDYPSVYINLRELETKLFLNLMYSVHITGGNLDSLDYYYPKLNLDGVSPDLASRGNSIMAYGKRLDYNFKDFLYYTDKGLVALENVKGERAKIRRIKTLFDLINFYTDFSSYHNAENTIKYARSILDQKPKISRYNTLSIELKQKEIKLLIKKDKFQDALNIMSSFDYDKLKAERSYFILSNYHKAKILIFRRLEKYTAAENELDNYITLQKKSKVQVPEIYNYINKLGIACEQKNIEKAKKYFNKLNELENKQTDKNFGFQNVKAEYYELTGNPKKALDLYKRAKKIKDSISDINFKVQAAISSYNLSKESELIKLEEVNKSKDALLAKSRKLFWSILISIVLVLLIIFILILNKRQKERLQLKFEVESTQNIAKAKQSYLENLAHEVRTLITIINGYFSLLQQHTLNPKKISSYAKLGLNSSDYMLQTFNDYLTFLKERKDSEPLHGIFYEKSELKIVAKLKERLKPFLAQAQLAKVSVYFKTNLDNDSRMMFSLKALLCILNNLISNALKFAPGDSSVYVSLLSKDNHIYLSVRDEGVGLSKDDLNKVFDRFYQSASNSTSSGFGIGLSLVKKIVSDLNGEIKVDSKLSEGACFEVKLPLTEDTNLTYLPKSEIAFEKLSLEVDDNNGLNSIVNNKPRLLLVDDNYAMLEYLNNLFEEDYQCYTVNNAEKAIEVLAQQNIDLIISDLKMHKMDGLRFKQELNKSEAYSDIPFILITATYIEDQNDLNLRYGIDEYISKPFSPTELKTRVQHRLEKLIYKRKATQEHAKQIDFVGGHSALIERIHQIIKANLNNSEYTVEMLANEFSYSQKQLNAILKSKIGLTLRDLILEVRLLEAYDLIIKGTYQTLSEVVHAIGLNSRAYFYKSFEKRFGVKPGELMKKYVT